MIYKPYPTVAERGKTHCNDPKHMQEEKQAAYSQRLRIQKHKRKQLYSSKCGQNMTSHCYSSPWSPLCLFSPHLGCRQYIEETELRGIRYKILEFNPMVLRGKVKPDSSRPDLLHPLNFVRFYLPLLDINHEKVIYLDDDVIVQGDVQDLFNIQLKPGHAAAFATDCDLPSTHEMVRSIGMQTTYMGFLDYRKQEVKDLGINPRDCSFNPGVFVADISEWKKQKITKQLERWMEENFRQNIYSSAMAGGVATPPMLIVFHGKYTTLDPLWHVRHLGWSPDARYPESILQEAHLLHWNGPFKPWNYPAVHLDLWERWFIPDPSGSFSLVRPDGDS
ncbi:glycosyltransferase 8 domain-containing 2 [Solea senegalensis]|uniref:Glycosyltransferase 8 domain-containing 2 n=1 Tax=Solea senegalensis TaxID=28829 RepID=A0AAV6R0Z9_SOLSE|nr:glycosyltransferase 8 domain-containing 2 [Solea senegalensis]